MQKSTTIKNQFNESLDTLIETPDQPKATVIMAHGIGTNKHETDGLFDHITESLVNKGFRIVRFDYAGFGKSEGRSEDFDLIKAGQDLKSVTQYTKETFEGKLYLIAQSMSTASVILNQPIDFSKVVFTAHVNPFDLVSGLQGRIRARAGGVVDEAGVSTYPRSDGSIQSYGSSLWQTMRQVHFIQGVKDFTNKTDLLVIRPKQDELIILSEDQLNILRKEFGKIYLEIDGDHSFRWHQSREQLSVAILDHFNS